MTTPLPNAGHPSVASGPKPIAQDPESTEAIAHKTSLPVAIAILSPSAASPAAPKPLPNITINQTNVSFWIRQLPKFLINLIYRQPIESLKNQVVAPDVLVRLPSCNFGHIHPDSVLRLKANHFRDLDSSQLEGFTAKMVANLSIEQIDALSPQQAYYILSNHLISVRDANLIYALKKALKVSENPQNTFTSALQHFEKTVLTQLNINSITPQELAILVHFRGNFSIQNLRRLLMKEGIDERSKKVLIDEELNKLSALNSVAEFAKLDDEHLKRLRITHLLNLKESPELVTFLEGIKAKFPGSFITKDDLEKKPEEDREEKAKLPESFITKDDFEKIKPSELTQVAPSIKDFVRSLKGFDQVVSILQYPYWLTPSGINSIPQELFNRLSGMKLYSKILIAYALQHNPNLILNLPLEAIVRLNRKRIALIPDNIKNDPRVKPAFYPGSLSKEVVLDFLNTDKYKIYSDSKMEEFLYRYQMIRADLSDGDKIHYDDLVTAKIWKSHPQAIPTGIFDQAQVNLLFKHDIVTKLSKEQIQSISYKYLQAAPLEDFANIKEAVKHLTPLQFGVLAQDVKRLPKFGDFLWSLPKEYIELIPWPYRSKYQPRQPQPPRAS